MFSDDVSGEKLDKFASFYRNCKIWKYKYIRRY